jgi:hypothetical protein
VELSTVLLARKTEIIDPPRFLHAAMNLVALLSWKPGIAPDGASQPMCSTAARLCKQPNAAARCGGGMTYRLTIEQKPTYLHAIVTGWNTRENVMRYVEDVIRECIARNCLRVLIEERLEGRRLGTLDVFEIVLEGVNRYRGMLKAIAYVDVNAEGDLMRFAENVAVNRAFPLAVFSTVADAEQWLLHEEPPRTAPSG